MSIVEAISCSQSCMMRKRRMKKERSISCIAICYLACVECNVLHTLLIGKMVDKVLFLGNVSIIWLDPIYAKIMPLRV